MPGAVVLIARHGKIVLEEALGRMSYEIDAKSMTRKTIFDPLDTVETQDRPAQSLLQRIAPTEFDPWRVRVVRGEVHDESVW